MHVKTDKPPSPRMKRRNGRRERKLQGPDIRPTARTSGLPRRPGHPAPSLDIWHLPVRRDRAKGPCIPLSLTPSWASTIYTSLAPPS